MRKRTEPTKHAAAAPHKQRKNAHKDSAEDPRDLVLSRRDAAAGGPADASVAGEEDPGVGLEFLVRKDLSE